MGRLHLIIGCMFSSKSTHLISLIRKYRAIDTKVLVINHIDDTRYVASHAVCSHDGVKEASKSLKILSDLKTDPDYVSSQVIFIEEAQFFSDLLEFVRHETDHTEKTFVVCGLSGGYKRQAVGDILQLIPLAEHIEHLSGLCSMCKDGTAGHFTKRIVDLPDDITIGGAEMYKCVCRKHWLLESLQILK